MTNETTKAVKFAKSYDVASGVFTGTHADGTTVSIALSDLPAEVVTQLTLHGLSQKLGDSISGKDVVGEVAIATVNAVIDNLKNGKFNLSGGGSQGGGIAVEAIARLMDRSIEDAAAFWETLDDKQRTAMKKDADVKAMTNIIKGERAAKSVDAGAFAAKFGG